MPASLSMCHVLSSGTISLCVARRRYTSPFTKTVIWRALNVTATFRFGWSQATIPFQGWKKPRRDCCEELSEFCTGKTCRPEKQAIQKRKNIFLSQQIKRKTYKKNGRKKAIFWQKRVNFGTLGRSYSWHPKRKKQLKKDFSNFKFSTPFEPQTGRGHLTSKGNL